mgnify:CR=1 FL=1
MKANRDRPFLAYYSMAVAHEVTDDLEISVPHGPFGRYDNYADSVIYYLPFLIWAVPPLPMGRKLDGVSFANRLRGKGAAPIPLPTVRKPCCPSPVAWSLMGPVPVSNGCAIRTGNSIMMIVCFTWPRTPWRNVHTWIRQTPRRGVRQGRACEWCSSK